MTREVFREDRPINEDVPVMERERSFGELLSRLAGNSAALVRDEIELAKQEMSEKVASLRSGFTILVVGAILAFLALMTLCAAAVIGLASFMGAGLAALIVGAALAVIGGAIAFIGLRQIKNTNMKPDKTIRTLKEDKEWLEEMT